MCLILFAMKSETEEQLLAAIGEDTSSFVKQGKMDGVKRWCWNGILWGNDLLNDFFIKKVGDELGSTSGVVLAAREILFRDIGSQMSKKNCTFSERVCPLLAFLSARQRISSRRFVSNLFSTLFYKDFEIF
ncbi:hypothetical protein Mgra_00009603 [Meloidogyne graminicola]|uniref:Uncharacterized protein n=1 Tax=Meloidogyne graminicola TaxID=189291 RepID=A0A8S9Z7F0_9BILA|nr:hypothetical protein Mgra_00009603 [Meloidogyne graminicola]